MYGERGYGSGGFCIVDEVMLAALEEAPPTAIATMMEEALTPTANRNEDRKKWGGAVMGDGNYET